MEKIIYANGTADVLVPAGQKIAIATYGNEYATLSFKRGNNLEFIQRLDNAQVTLGPWADARTVSIEAAQDQVSYDVATNPSIDSNVRLNTNPLTGISALVGGGIETPINFGSLAAAQKVFGVGSGGTAIGAGTTLVTQHPAEFDFVGAQLLYHNQAAAAISVTKARVAATATHTDVAASAAWYDVTFGGAASGTVPASPGGSASDTLSGYLLSDYIPVMSVARTDDITKTPLLQSRSYFAAAANGMSTSAGEIAAWNAGPASFGRQYAARAPAGDATATFTASQQPLEAGTWVVPYSVVFHYSAGVREIVTCGDSLTKGHLTTGGATSWPAILGGLLRTSGKRYAVNNIAWTGQKHYASLATCKALVQAKKPDYVTFFAWSPNDALAASVTQATFDEGYSRAIEMISWCKKNDVVPVVCTSGAYNALNGAQNSMRKANNARVLALRASGIKVLDFASVIDNPANDGQINPIYNSGDGLHYNDACHLALAALAATAW